MFTRKDLVYSIITGLISGLITWRVLVFLGFLSINLINTKVCDSSCLPSGVCAQIYCLPAYLVSFNSYWLIVIIPILWILGVNLGYFLGKWIGFFNQFGKFAAVGFTNAAVYFGILNLQINFSGINKGIWYSVFVASAFIIATVHSYFWNKIWVFSSEGKIFGEELGKFFGVYIIAGVINTGIATAVVALIDPIFGLTADQWANIGGVAGSAVALVFSFAGVKVAVFKTSAVAQ